MTWLLMVGLAITPFILAPGGSDIAREPKMAWALVFALSIVLTAIYQGQLKPFKNKWAVVLVGFCLLSFYLSPKPDLKFFGIPSGRFWSWEPLYQTLVFFLFTVAVSSIQFTKKTLLWVLKVMMYSGVVMAGFVLLQALRLDQFFEHRYCFNGHMAGTMGNPVFVGPFLCLVLPLAIWLKKYMLAVVMGIAAVITQSDIAIIGLIATLGAYFALKNKKWCITIVGLGVTCAALIGALYFTVPEFRRVCPDNERFLTWGNSIKDLTTPVMRDSKKIYAMTGIGLGSFKYLYHAKYNQRNDNFLYAHNDYVQAAYETGVLGLGLLLGALGTFFYGLRKVIGTRGERRALLAGCTGLLVCAGGIFVLQIGTHIFYLLTLIGLLSNDSVVESEGETNV